MLILFSSQNQPAENVRRLEKKEKKLELFSRQSCTGFLKACRKNINLNLTAAYLNEARFVQKINNSVTLSTKLFISLTM